MEAVSWTYCKEFDVFHVSHLPGSMPGRGKVFSGFKKFFPDVYETVPVDGAFPPGKAIGKGGEDMDIPWETATARSSPVGAASCC